MIRNLWKGMLNAFEWQSGGAKLRYCLVHAGLSDVGLKRSSNQDGWFVDSRQQLYIVSDGMGGLLGGEIASRAVVEVLPMQLHEILAETEDVLDQVAQARIVDAIAEFSRHVWRGAGNQPTLSGMGATLLFVLVRGDHALIIHMGDSRSYLYRNGSLACITRDHTIVQTLLDNGVIDASEAVAHPARNQLTRYIGMAADPIPERQIIKLAVGDRLLLCTDGLSGVIANDQLRSIFSRESPPAEACRLLIDAANRAGGQDNATVLIVDVHET
jgi:PPM family protein phosphatase